MAEKRVFDKETQALLSGLMPFGAGVAHEYCVVGDDSPVPVELRPVVVVRAFNRAERRQAFDLLKRFKDLSSEEIEKAHELVRVCCSGWRNIWDLSTGSEIEYVGAKNGIGADPEVWFDMSQLLRSQVFTYLCRISCVYDFHALGLRY
jgi:hypothetical protein